MDEKTLEALNGSIEKWRKIECEDGVDLGIKNCPLCELFFKKHCKGCPIYEETLVAGCGCTPYYMFILELNAYREENGISSLNDTSIAWTDTLAKLARNERLFLESLLP